MAVADSVPGVSGGTIAFLLGFYEKFVVSVHDFLMGLNERRRAVFPFLFKLGVGWVAGFLTCAVILANLFDVHIYEICSVFIGLTLVSIPVVAYEERETIKGHPVHLIFTAAGALLVFLLIYLNPVSGRTSSVDLTDPSLGLAIFLFIAAMIAVSALVLPGISGSTLLLIMGLYVPLISGVNAVLHLELAYVPMMAAFALGMLAGLVFIVKIVKYCFERHRSPMIYLAIGLLIGSVYAIAMGPATLAEPLPPLGFANFSVLWFLAGGAVLAVLEYVKITRARAE
jgi:putative membrane protein